MDKKEVLRKRMHAWKFVCWFRKSDEYSRNMENHYLDLWYKYQDLLNEAYKAGIIDR